MFRSREVIRAENSGSTGWLLNHFRSQVTFYRPTWYLVLILSLRSKHHSVFVRRVCVSLTVSLCTGDQLIRSVGKTPKRLKLGPYRLSNLTITFPGRVLLTLTLKFFFRKGGTVEVTWTPCFLALNVAKATYRSSNVTWLFLWTARRAYIMYMTPQFLFEKRAWPSHFNPCAW